MSKQEEQEKQKLSKSKCQEQKDFLEWKKKR